MPTKLKIPTMNSVYTKRQRHKIYKEALNTLNTSCLYTDYTLISTNSNFFVAGLCTAVLKNLMNPLRPFEFNLIRVGELQKVFPELKDFLDMPRNKHGYVYPPSKEWGHTIRAMVLLEAIKKTR
jgi:hypothetical protein